ncbi:MAG: class IV adenylate cyclase [Candidatus Kryptonium sp.]|nr:class IV adenylate cyclase [Candidatus Kryptonium sp.]
MPRNLEIKAEITEPDLVEKIAIEIGAKLANDFVQVDTYFEVKDGRLKLREFDLGEAELIFYRRAENNFERWSDYEIVKVNNSEALKNLLSKALSVKIVVEKRRKVYIYKNARIHVDTVKGLGNFVELEVIYNGDEKQVEELMKFLINAFGLKRERFIKVSYSDLLLQKQNGDIR